MADETLKHKTKVGLYWKFFEQFSAYGMQFIVGVIMARLLSPTDFGIAALPAVFIAIAQVFIDGSFGLALIRKPEVNEKDLSTSFYYSIVVGLFSYIFLFLLAPYIADFYDTPILTPLVRVTAISFIWNPLIIPQTVILNRRLDFKTPAKISIINKIISAILGISAAYYGYGIWALVIATVSSSFFGFIQTWLAVKWLPRAKFSKNSFNYLWNFGNKMMGATLLGTLYNNIVPVIVGKTIGVADLGFYNRAKQFASLPSSNFTGIINSVTFPVLSKLQDNEEQFAVQYRRMIKDSSFVVFPIMVLLSVLARPLVITLLTEKWEGCVILLQIMCFTYMFQPAQILNLNLLQIKGRTDLTLKLEIFKKIFFTIVILVAIKYGLVVLCVVDFLLTMVALVLNTYYTGKLINVGYFKQVKDLLPSLILSLLMALIVILLLKVFANDLTALIVCGLTGILVYFGMAKILGFSELDDVIYMINRNS